MNATHYCALPSAVGGEVAEAGPDSMGIMKYTSVEHEDQKTATVAVDVSSNQRVRNSPCRTKETLIEEREDALLTAGSIRYGPAAAARRTGRTSTGGAAARINAGWEADKWQEWRMSNGSRRCRPCRIVAPMLTRPRAWLALV